MNATTPRYPRDWDTERVAEPTHHTRTCGDCKAHVYQCPERPTTYALTVATNLGNIHAIAFLSKTEVQQAISALEEIVDGFDDSYTRDQYIENVDRRWADKAFYAEHPLEDQS